MLASKLQLTSVHFIPVRGHASRNLSLILMQNLRERLPSPLLLPTLAQALLTQLLLRESSRVRIQSQEYLLVLERILLLHSGPLRSGVALWFVEHALHFAAVDQTGDVGVADDVAGEEEVRLQLRGLGRGAVDVV